MITRRIEPADATCLRDIRLRALRADPFAFGSTYEREVARDSVAWVEWATAHSRGAEKATFLAFRESTPIGIAASGRESDTATFGLYAMWVAPEARRTGAGRALVDEVLAWATRQGAKRIQLWVTQPNAIIFYERCGFTDDGRRQPLPHTPSVLEKGMTRLIA